MNNLEAINERQSRRAYLVTPIAPDNTLKLNNLIKEYNALSGLTIQFIEDGKEAFHGLNISYGMFRGVQSFIAIVGKKDDNNLLEKTGYYGELLVLEATKLGLGTCWIGGTFNRKKCPCTLQEDETLVLIISIGNVIAKKTFKENTIYKLVHRRTKSVEQLYTADGIVPGWFLAGMTAVQKAPSAMNAQPVHFEYKGGLATAAVSLTNHYQLIDLGIAKAHFEIAADGKFENGNKGAFIKA